ncbi:MAG: methyltransferase domain-containing protein [Gemmatimonadota bacterium]|jgi:SAM-dependent methyltransferase|nr:methyltransferase domain-containing protein [Gemmatimonadota bacterium]
MDANFLFMSQHSSESSPGGSFFGRIAPRGVPSVLDLVRLSPEPVFPPGGEALYRQIGLFTEMRPGQEILVAACGRGLTTAYLAVNQGVHCIGVDPDPQLVAEAEQRIRAMGLDNRITFETASLDDLPWQDGVFDVTVGEIALGAMADPAAAIRELARVTKPLGLVVLVQLVWSGNVDEEQRENLLEHLGTRPLFIVEWKQFLRDAGCVDLHVEDWSDAASPFRPVSGPMYDLTKQLSLRQKVAVFRRALGRWGWRGMRGALMREQEIHNLLSNQRVLGLSLIIGAKWHPDGL